MAGANLKEIRIYASPDPDSIQEVAKCSHSWVFWGFFAQLSLFEDLLLCSHPNTSIRFGFALTLYAPLSSGMIKVNLWLSFHLVCTFIKHFIGKTQTAPFLFLIDFSRCWKHVPHVLKRDSLCSEVKKSLELVNPDWHIFCSVTWCITINGKFHTRWKINYAGKEVT